MIVKCIENTNRNLPPEYFQTFRAESDKTVYHVSVGKAYTVFAIAIWRLQPMILISDDTDLPNWYAPELFSVIDPHLSPEWCCALNVKSEGGLRAICGYEEIVQNEGHNDALMDRQKLALSIFANEKQRLQQNL
jgi:hypothetical protein